MTPKKYKNKISIAIAALFIAFIDYITKIGFYSLLGDVRAIDITPILTLKSNYNTGVSFGLLSDARLNQNVMSVLLILIVTLFALLMKANNRVEKCSLAMITGGGIGNIADRLEHGAVYDFIGLHIGQYYWPFFNFADMCITIGTVMLLYSTLKHKDR